VPFVARWPGRIKPGSVCDDTVCLNDFLATCAEIVNAKLPDNAGKDSVSILPDRATRSASEEQRELHHPGTRRRPRLDLTTWPVRRLVLTFLHLGTRMKRNTGIHQEQSSGELV